MAKKNIHGEMNGLLSFLNEREREIIEARFGLNGNADGQTLDELGVIFGVSRERIRQVQNEALDKMRKKMRRTEQERSAPHDKDKLIANVASIIAILRAE